MNANQLIKQVSLKTPAELAPLEGKWVAWSEDGHQVLAEADDLAGLYKEIDRRGLTHYVVDSIPLADESFLGGATI